MDIKSIETQLRAEHGVNLAQFAGADAVSMLALGLVPSPASPTIASATTITPTSRTNFVSGTTEIVTITVPDSLVGIGAGACGEIVLIPTGAWTTSIAGNIATAITAVANRPVRCIWDSTAAKWYLSYEGTGNASTGQPLSQFAATTSAQLAGVMSDETGTGALVFANTPTLVTPVLGAATATSIAIGGATAISSQTGTGGVVVMATSPTLVTPVLGVASATSVAATGAVTSSGTAGIGYATGAGGAVTQDTSVTTTVVLNKTTGAITTFSQTAAAGVDVSFTLTNSTIAANDVVVVSTKSYAGTADGIPIASVQATAAGSCIINIRNTGAVALDAAVVLNFAVIKGVAA